MDTEEKDKSLTFFKDSCAYGVEVAKQILTISSAGVLFLAGLVFSNQNVDATPAVIIAVVCQSISILFGLLFIMGVTGHINKYKQYDVYTTPLRLFALLQIIAFLAAICGACVVIFTFTNPSPQTSTGSISIKSGNKHISFPGESYSEIDITIEKDGIIQVKKKK
jgi:hypothetical protein